MRLGFCFARARQGLCDRGGARGARLGRGTFRQGAPGVHHRAGKCRFVAPGGESRISHRASYYLQERTDRTALSRPLENSAGRGDPKKMGVKMKVRKFIALAAALVLAPSTAQAA